MESVIVTSFAQSDLSNEESFAHKTNFRKLMLKYGVDNLQLGNYATRYDEAYDRFDALTEIIRKSDQTAELAEDDTFRDELTQAFFLMVKASLRHYDHERRKDAERVNIVCNQFRDAPDLSYTAETASLRNMIQALEPLSGEIERLALAEWVNQIAMANDAFDDEFLSRNEAASRKVKDDTKTVRKMLDRLVNKIVALVAGYADINDQPVFNEFLSEADALHKSYANLLAQRVGRKIARNKKKSDTENE